MDANSRLNHGGTNGLLRYQRNAGQLSKKLRVDMLELQQRMQPNHEEAKKNDANISNLVQVLRMMRKERNETKNQLNIPQIQRFTLANQPQDPSSIKHSRFVARIDDYGLHSDKINHVLMTKSLPDKGKLVEAVKNAGNDFEIQLLHARTPVPQWKNPPPLDYHQVLRYFINLNVMRVMT